MPDRCGLALPLAGLALADHPPLLRRLADAGWTDLWAGEANGTDAVGVLAAAAGCAPSLRLGTGVLPAYTRGPALLAMAAATLAGLAPDRVVVGIGASSPTVVADWNGLPYDRPYARTRDLLTFLRAALAGERVSRSFETFAVDGFRLERPPAVPPALAVAALRPRMLRLAAEQADAVVLAWLSAADVARSRAVLAGAGRPVEVVAFLFVCPTEDADATRAALRRRIAHYLSTPGYAAFQRWLGRGDELAPMWAAWERGDVAGAAAAVPERVLDELFVVGDAEACRAGIAGYRDAGVDTPVLLVEPGPGYDPLTAVAALAPAAVAA